MNQSIYEILEFDRILEDVAAGARTEIGREAIQSLKASSQIQRVQRLQAETGEARRILSDQKSIPIPGLRKLYEPFKRLELGTSINGQELAQIGKLLTTCQELRRFFAVYAEEQVEFNYLCSYYDQIIDLSDVLDSVQATVDETGAILSSASSQLQRIRRQLAATENKSRDQLNSLLKRKGDQLSDSLITIRNNRYVLPVKAEYKASFPGTIHDQSATGQTVYIEPESVVQLNNQRAQLQSEEKLEIQRILKGISDQLRPYLKELAANETMIGHLDAIQARAFYSHTRQLSQPNLSSEGHVALWQVKHPLIDSEKVVANDILIGDQYRSLVITGPNTGGKTILLKTLGLVQMMGQAGLHIPAEEGSQIGIFDGIYADIGDEQSLEQNLSTFSGHMTRIIQIIHRASSDSLVLLDELGSGTDPQEGAALAMAILDYFNKRQVTVMATTHYPELKVYAHQRADTINASMEFDSVSLQPTYRLLIGVPGRSNALDISKNLGLPSEILDQARQGVSHDNQAINEMVAQLERDRRKSERLSLASQRTLDQAQSLKDDLEREYQSWLNAKEQIIAQAKTEANARIDKIEAEAEKVLQEIRDLQLQQGQAATIKEHQLIDKRKDLESLKQANQLEKNKVLRRAKKKQNLVVGDDVYLSHLGQKGVIVDQEGPDDYVVQIGVMKMTVSGKQLEKQEPEGDKVKVNINRRIASQVSPQLDLRGERFDTAMQKLDIYLDSALLANHPMVTIIHGKGTGAIRQGVQEALKSHPQVARFQYSPPNAGGNGSTQAYFK